MGGVTKWAAALCTVAIGCTALQMIAPKKGMGNIFKMITAAFFLCCLVSPLLSAKSILDIDVNKLPEEVTADVIKDKVEQQFKDQVNVSLEMTAKQTLKNYDINVAKIEVNMDTDEKGSIYISGVVLYLDKQNMPKAITAKQVMEKILGVNVSIETIGE